MDEKTFPTTLPNHSNSNSIIKSSSSVHGREPFIPPPPQGPGPPVPTSLLPHAPTVQVTHQIELLNPPQSGGVSEAADTVTNNTAIVREEEKASDTLNQPSIIESMSGQSTNDTSVTSEASDTTVMAQTKTPQDLKPIIPNDGTVIDSESLGFIFCKPKLLPIKSITIEKLEQLQQTANERARKQELEESK